MTVERQDITTDFYSGNSKTIRVNVKTETGDPKDLDSAEITYVIFKESTGEIILSKSSNRAGEITIDTPTSNGIAFIHLLPPDTVHIFGTFRHHCNVVDKDGLEETVFSGKIEIHTTNAHRIRQNTKTAYLQG